MWINHRYYRKDSSMVSSRSRTVDIARGIAMIAIVIGHLGVHDINRVVFTFHLPIFFIITGYYLKTDESFKAVVKKRFRTLIVPYFLTCAAVIIFAVIINILNTILVGDGESIIDVLLLWVYASLYGAGDNYLEPYFIKGIGAIWFLWATFWGVIFVKLILKAKSPFRSVLVLIVFLVGYFSRLICWIPLSIQAGCCGTLYIYIGTKAKDIQSDFERTSSEIKIGLLIVALAAWINFIVQFESFWLVHCDIGRGPIDIIGSLCACYVLIVLCKAIDKGPQFISKGLALFGKYSLFALVAHDIELNTFPWEIITTKLAELGYGLSIQLLAKTICKFIWIIAISLIFAKTNWIRRLFGIKPLKKNL